MRNTLIILATLTLFTVGCGKTNEFQNSNAFGVRKQLGEVIKKRLPEASGLAASVANEGLLWTINDSGNKPEVYLINENVEIQLTCRLKGLKIRDWEDVAVGPGPKAGVNYIYVGEIGDNLARYPTKYIFRFEEPKLDSSMNMTITDFDTLAFRLPDEIKDTEALMIHPTTKDLYVISKRENPVTLYQLPYPQDSTNTSTAKKIITLPIGMVVASTFSPDGKELLVKNYKNIYYWNIDDQPLPDALKKPASKLTYEEEPQGESIAFAKDNSGYYTISEVIKGEKSYLYFYPRAKIH